MFDKESLRELVRIYRKETSYLLNHFTLNIREPSIARERLRFNNIQVGKIGILSIVFMIVHSCFRLLNISKAKRGNPITFINMACNFILVGLLYVSHWFKHYKMSVACYYLFYFVHAFSVILVYGDWLPDTFTVNKFALHNSNIINYIVVMCLPVHSFMRTFLIMTPIFLLTVYVQSSYDSSFLERIHEHLPPELQAGIPVGFSVLNTVRNMSIIPGCFFITHYLQNL
jgi:hypothetical protein